MDKRRRKCLDWLCRPKARLRGDDCMKYHPGKPQSAITTARVYEVFAVANIVGGTIGIPMQEGLRIIDKN